MPLAGSPTEGRGTGADELEPKPDPKHPRAVVCGWRMEKREGEENVDRSRPGQRGP